MEIYNCVLIKNTVISIKKVSGKKIVKTTNAECRNSACGERIFIIQAPLELHMIDKSGEGRNEINIRSLKKRLESLPIIM